MDVVDAILGGALENVDQEDDGSVPEPEFQSALNVANSLGVRTYTACQERCVERVVARAQH